MRNPLRPLPGAPPEPPEPATADRDWFGGRRWTGIGALAVLVVVGLCMVAVVVLGGGKHNTATGPTPTPATSTNSTPAPDLPTTIPTSAPANTNWTIYETVALPSIPGVGPTHIDGAIATGYAHTPTGALLAAANESYRYLLAPDTQWAAAASAMLAPGAGYDAWVRVRSANPYGMGGAGGSTLAQIVAFQFISYTPETAAIQLVTRDSRGTYQVAASQVVWHSGDWKFVPGPDGGQAANVQVVQSLAGFNEWRGV